MPPVAPASASAPAPTAGSARWRDVAAPVAFVAACVADLPLIYLLVRADADARLAPLVILFAASSMAAAYAAGLVIEGRRATIPLVIALVLIAEAPLLVALRSVSRFEGVPASALPWVFAAAAAALAAAVVLGVTTRARGREAARPDPR